MINIYPILKWIGWKKREIIKKESVEKKKGIDNVMEKKESKKEKRMKMRWRKKKKVSPIFL